MLKEGQDEPIRYEDLPGMDAAYFRGWAQTLRQVDPDVIEYHAGGRIHEYVESDKFPRITLEARFA